MESRRLPKFANEKEEADWWYEHREELAQDFVAAIREGRLGEGSRARYLRRMKEKETAPTQQQPLTAGNSAK